MSLNSVNLMGRLTKDPELRFTQNQTAVATFTLAVDRDYQSGGSERQVDFVEVVSWRKTAEFVSKYFHKGQMMALHGSLQSRKWQDKYGNNRVSWEVIADRVSFCGDQKAENNAAIYNGQGVNVSADTFEDLPDDVGGVLPF